MTRSSGHEPGPPPTETQRLEEQIREQEAALEALRAEQADAGKARRALLALLEDLEGTRERITAINREWMAAFDAVGDPIFMHDAAFRVIRANRAYAERAGLSWDEIIGRRYWETFPLRDGPLPGCTEAAESAPGPQEEFTAPDGAVYHSRAYVVRDADDHYRFSVHLLEDVTEARRAQTALAARIRRQSALVGMGERALEEPDLDILLQACAERTAAALGTDFCEVLEWQPAEQNLLLHAGVGWQDGLVGTATVPAGAGSHGGYTLEVSEPVVIRDLADDERIGGATLLREHGVTSGMSVVIPGADSPFGVLGVHTAAPRTFDEDEAAFLQGVAHLLAAAIARRRAEGRAQEQASLLETMFQAIDIRMAYMDRAFNFIRVNQAYAEADDREPDDFPGQNHFDLYPHPENEAIFREVVETGEPYTAFAKPFVYPGHPERGTSYWDWRLQPVQDSGGRVTGVVLTLNDVTERERARQELAEAEQRFHAIFDNARDGIALADIETRRFNTANAAFCEMVGYSPEEVPGLGVADLHPPDALEYVRKRFKLQVRGEESLAPDVPVLRRDGSVFPADVNATPVTLGNRTYLLGVFRDITERKAAEAAIARANRALRTLSRGNEVLVHARDEDRLLADVCRTAVEQGGYRLAWVGYAEEAGEKRVRPVAQAGHDAGYVDAVRASWADGPRGRGPVGRAIREGRPAVVRDIANDETFTPWREASLERGYGSLAAFPLHSDDQIRGVLVLYAGEPNAFDEDELKLLTELADDLAYGIRALRTGRAHERDMQRLQDLLYATIRAIALTVEKRDPYTAGHQERVARLATAIAREQAMAEDRIEGIRLGALIHDIGKVYIPAEILTRPGRLSAIEFDLVMTHPEVGREIVADIPFPWPVAEMIHQHHERLDGSGYPQGIEGDAIIPEARILAVADVVEAVASHRPYRPALGIEKGLEVIEAGRGTLFDPGAVDTCLHLCRGGGFEFNNAE